MSRATLSRGAPRRGVALLLVLAAVLVGLAAATVAAQAATAASLARRAERDRQIADDAARSLARAAEDWLARSADRVALAPDAVLPAVEVLAEEVVLEASSVEVSSLEASSVEASSVEASSVEGPAARDGASSLLVRIVAFDQRGMVPWREAREARGLATTLPPEVVRAVRDAATPSLQPMGLDLIGAHGVDGGEGRASPAIRVWPGASGDRPERGDAAIGALVATHAVDEIVVNVHTAPEPLVRAAEAITGRAVWDAVVEARLVGRASGAFGVASVGDTAVAAGADTPSEAVGEALGEAIGERSIRFVGASDLWSFRVDARFGAARSAWWLTYARTSGSWRLVQQLRITE